MRLRSLKPCIAILMLSVFGGCLSGGKPRDLAVIRDFELEPYLGTWYEIARLDHRFERDLDHCRAEYSLREDGRVRVLNRGRQTATGVWKTAEGVARLSGAPGEGSLRVSFFGPFYGGYNILAWRRETPSYALVCGNTREYFWILSRDPHLPPEMLDAILPQLGEWGFATNRLIWVRQDNPAARAL